VTDADSGSAVAPVVGYLAFVSSGSPTFTLPVITFSFAVGGAPIGSQSGGAGAGKVTFSDLLATFPAGVDTNPLLQAEATGASFENVQMSIITKASDEPEVFAVFKLVGVAGLTSSLNDAGRSVVAVDLKYAALRTTTPSASGDAGGCPASCCSADGGQAYALGPYVEAAPGWPVPSGTTPMSGFDFATSSVGGMFTVAPVSFTTGLDDDAICAFGAVASGAPVTAPAVFHVESPASATSGTPTDSQTVSVCSYTVSTIAVSSTAAGPIFQIAIAPASFVSTEPVPGDAAADASTTIFGWSLVTDESITSCQ